MSEESGDSSLNKDKALSEMSCDSRDVGEMSLTDHLRELRNRLLICLAAIVITMLIGLFFSSDLVGFLLEIGKGLYQFVYISPQELMLQYIYVAFVFALVMSLPVLLFEIWSFIRPGLKKSENSLFLATVICGLVFFCIGVIFSYCVMLPFMLEFFFGLSEGTDILGFVSVGNYISFVLTVLIIFGIVFELPVVSLLLNRLGLIRISWMKKARRFVIVLIFFVAAVITPPDVVSQVITALPMIVLYELSIYVCSAAEKFKPMRSGEGAESGDV